MLPNKLAKPRSYASSKLCPLNHLITYLLTRVKSRATSVAKNKKRQTKAYCSTVTYKTKKTIKLFRKSN